MARLLVAFASALAILQGGSAAVLRASLRQGPSQKPSLEGYSFAQFVRDFGRSYVSGSKEYASRAAQFEASLARVNAVNTKNLQEGRAWSSGVHPFMDWFDHERVSLISGYKPSGTHRSRISFAALQTGAGAGAKASVNASFGDSLGDTSWGEQLVVRNQGSCGSCWAFSAMEAIEARLPANTRLSAQALVDCAPNPHHCGGQGGCDGATAQLAYAYVKDHGIPLESDYAYNQQTGSCRAQSGARARISGWTPLPSNKASPLLEALYSQGPVAVNVDGNPWFDYDNGVFDGCQKDAMLGHGVLLKGYGGQGSGQYWTVQNSWGANWGEHGNIRLRRRDAAEEEAYCGTDNKPQEGTGCDGGPPSIRVCGMCGILYDASYPEGVTMDTSATVDITDIAPSKSTASSGYEMLKVEDFEHPIPEQPKAKALSAVAAEATTSSTRDVDLMKNIFRPAESADDVKTEMEKNAVERMQAMLRRGQN